MPSVLNGTVTNTSYAMAGRFTAQGTLDPSFGNGGVTFAPQWSTPESELMSAVALYPSPDAGDPTDTGKVVLAGVLTQSNHTNELVVARYLGDPPSPVSIR